MTIELETWVAFFSGKDYRLVFSIPAGQNPDEAIREHLSEDKVQRYKYCREARQGEDAEAVIWGIAS